MANSTNGVQDIEGTDGSASAGGAESTERAVTTASEEFPDIADLPYEAARDELIGIVAQLEGGQVGLEDSMRLWRRGEALAAHCSTWLDDAEASLTADAE